VNIGTSEQSGGAFGGEKKRVAEENQDLMLESLYEAPNQTRSTIPQVCIAQGIKFDL
jgi:hypothetical protein